MSQTFTPLSQWIKCPFCGSRYDPAKLEHGNCLSCGGDLLHEHVNDQEDALDYYPPQYLTSPSGRQFGISTTGFNFRASGYNYDRWEGT